jgi:hypothetical protein
LIKSGVGADVQNVATTTSVLNFTNSHGTRTKPTTVAYQDNPYVNTSTSRYEPTTTYDYVPITASDHTTPITSSYATAYDKDNAYTTNGTAEYSYKYTSVIDSHPSSNHYGTYGTNASETAGRGLSNLGGADELKYSIYEEHSNVDSYGSPSALGHSALGGSRTGTGGAFGVYTSKTIETNRYDSTAPNNYEYSYNPTTIAQENEPYKVELDNDLMRDLQKLKSGQQVGGVAPTSSSISFGTTY